MSHSHSHAPGGANYNKRFLLGILLNLFLVIIQVFYGLQANSVALVSDGLHNAADVLSLIIAWAAFRLSMLKISDKFTYGLKNTTILAAFINAVLLFIAVGGITWEAVERISHPQSIQADIVLVIALLGALINGSTAILFLSGKRDINLWGAFLHLALDAAVSLGVVVVSIGILLTRWLWLDPAISLIISGLIVVSSWALFKESTHLMLQAVPAHINLKEVRAFLLKQPQVKSIHDLHVWGLSTSETALSVHVVTTQLPDTNAFIQHLMDNLRHQFHIQHSTIQIETSTNLLKCEISCD